MGSVRKASKKKGGGITQHCIMFFSPKRKKSCIQKNRAGTAGLRGTGTGSSDLPALHSTPLLYFKENVT